jgi:hypothetical protein
MSQRTTTPDPGTRRASFVRETVVLAHPEILHEPPRVNSMMNPMTYDQLLDRIISDGIAEVRVAYAAPEDHHKRDGAISGFEACRGKTPPELVALWTAAEEEARQLRAACQKGRDLGDRRDSQDYWRSRYRALQIEFVCNVVSVGLANNGQPPLLAHQPTLRGVLKYAKIVGTRGQKVLS